MRTIQCEGFAIAGFSDVRTTGLVQHVPEMADRVGQPQRLTRFA